MMPTLELAFRARLGAFDLAVDERVPVGGVTALFGPSGSGKTSLLRVIAGLEKRAQGVVSFDGDVWQRDAFFVPAHRRRIGYVFQDGRLFPHLTVARNLGFGARHGARAPHVRLDDVIAALELAPLLDRRPATLSGGEQQRVAIGRAMLAGPRLLLMDEPLSSLDVSRKREVIGYVERLRAEFDLPVLYVTHNVDELIRLADRMVLISRGRIAAQGTVRDLLDRIDLAPLIGPADAGSLVEARVAAHRDGMTVLDLEGERLLVPEVAAPVDRVLRLRIHAREVVIATERPARLSIRNVLAARVERVDADVGVYADVSLQIGTQRLRARITKHAVTELGIAPGQAVYALIKAVAFGADEYSLLGGAARAAQAARE